MSQDKSDVYLNSMGALEMFLAFAMYHGKYPYNPHASASFYKYFSEKKPTSSYRLFDDISYILRTNVSTTVTRKSVSAAALLTQPQGRRKDPIVTLAFYENARFYKSPFNMSSYNDITTQNDVIDALKSVDFGTISLDQSPNKMSIAETCFYALNNYLNPIMSVLFARWLTVYQINLAKYKLFNLKNYIDRNHGKETLLDGIAKSFYLDLEIEINEKIPVRHALFPSIETDLSKSNKHVQSATIGFGYGTARHRFNVATVPPVEKIIPDFLKSRKTLVVLVFKSSNSLSEVAVYSTDRPAKIELEYSDQKNGGRHKHVLSGTPVSSSRYKFTYKVTLNWLFSNNINVSGSNFNIVKVNLSSEHISDFSYAHFNPIVSVHYNILRNPINKPDYYSYLFSQFSFPKYKVKIDDGHMSFFLNNTQKQQWTMRWISGHIGDVSLEIIAPSMFVNSVANMKSSEQREKFEFYLVVLMYLGLLHPDLQALFQELGSCSIYYLNAFTLETLTNTNTNTNNPLNLTHLAATVPRLTHIEISEFTESLNISIPQHSSVIVTKIVGGVKEVNFKNLDILGCNVKITCSLFLVTPMNVNFLLFNFSSPMFYFMGMNGFKRSRFDFVNLLTTNVLHEGLGKISVDGKPLTFNSTKKVYEYTMGSGSPFYGYFVTNQSVITLNFKSSQYDDEEEIEFKM